MKIDFDHWRGSQIADEIQNQITLDMQLSILKALNPILNKDGNQWCYLYGENLQVGVAGFGDTPYLAMVDFVHNFQSEKVVVVK